MPRIARRGIFWGTSVLLAPSRPSASMIGRPDVWIIHDPADAEDAAVVRSSLGRPGRNVEDWPEDGEAIATVGVVVLLYSCRAVADVGLVRRIGIAIRHRRPIVVYRLDPTPPLGALQTLLERSVWIDGRDRGEASLIELDRQIRDAAEVTKTAKSAENLRPRRVLGVSVQTDSGPIGEAEGSGGPIPWKGWAVSLVLHGLVLGILALCFASVKTQDDRTLTAEFGGGDPNGSLDGWSERMGGLDLPEIEAGPSLAEPGLTTLLPPSLDMEPAPRPASASGSGGGSGGEGFGLSLFGPGKETIRGVQVRTGDPQFTLIWDAKCDLDLHVLEPGGEHIFWVNKGKMTRLGGMLDVDNVIGFGPENVFWEHDQGPPGEYKWYVEYFGGFGALDVPTRWQVRIKQDGQERVVDGRFRRIGERSKTQTLKVGPRANPPRD